jgi:hypothetical protein
VRVPQQSNTRGSLVHFCSSVALCLSLSHRSSSICSSPLDPLLSTSPLSLVPHREHYFLAPAPRFLVQHSAHAKSWEDPGHSRQDCLEILLLDELDSTLERHSLVRVLAIVEIQTIEVQWCRE